jgi:integrase
MVRLLAAAQRDWHGTILLAATSGLRLGDAANLCWESIDLENRLIRVTTGKTGTVVVYRCTGISPVGSWASRVVLAELLRFPS